MTRDNSLSEALFDDFFINSPFAIAKTTVVGTLMWVMGAAVIAAHEQREKMRALHEQYDGKLEAVLTPAQLSRWNALKDARKAMRPRSG